MPAPMRPLIISKTKSHFPISRLSIKLIYVVIFYVLQHFVKRNVVFLFLVIKKETRRSFYSYQRELRIGSCVVISISPYIHFLKLFLNYISTHNIKIVSGKIIMNYPDDYKREGKLVCCYYDTLLSGRLHPW